MKKVKHIFVVQKHAATHLHYDFRLEIDGVLVSWAVPKGPSMNPKDKRLAISTEDHPLEYAQFEGVIPEGSYGAGTVMVFDTGFFENIKSESLSMCLRKGLLEFVIHGTIFKGRFSLIKLKHARTNNAWLLIKKHDEFADETFDILCHDHRSALTDRTMDEIKKNYE